MRKQKRRLPLLPTHEPFVEPVRKPVNSGGETISLLNAKPLGFDERSSSALRIFNTHRSHGLLDGLDPRSGVIVKVVRTYVAETKITLVECATESIGLAIRMRSHQDPPCGGELLRRVLVVL